MQRRGWIVTMVVQVKEKLSCQDHGHASKDHNSINSKGQYLSKRKWRVNLCDDNNNYVKTLRENHNSYDKQSILYFNIEG